jgi:hypothetical protein
MKKLDKSKPNPMWLDSFILAQSHSFSKKAKHYISVPLSLAISTRTELLLVWAEQEIEMSRQSGKEYCWRNV